ncbi:MAG: ABC transporter substrate-binding protein [Candidatus Parcubacteria bacterium]|nr:ABC transporter substrate-binding protein [Candidatus Parcubacteria bacterium]
MNKKIIVSAIVLFIIFIIACVIWKQTRPKPKYTGPIEKVVLADDLSILNLIAKEKGFFTENGLDARITKVASGLSAIDDLLAGKVDIAPATDFVGIEKIYGNKNLRILTQLSKNKGISIIARKHKGISQPSDLKGKTIGVAKKTVGEFFLGQFLTANDLSFKDVTEVNLTSEEIVNQIENGETDAIAVWEPYVYSISEKMGNKIVVWSDDSGIFLLTYSTDEFIKAHPVIVERYLRTMVQTVQYIKNNSTEAKATVAKNFHFGNAYMEYTWPLYDFNISLDQSLLPELESEARFSIANKLTNQTEVPNYLNFIYFDALEKIKPEAITIIK